MVSENKKIAVGDYVNFEIRRVYTNSSGAKMYTLKHNTGKVQSICMRDNLKLYKVKVNNKQEYYEISRFKITHVWYTISNEHQEKQYHSGLHYGHSADK